MWLRILLLEYDTLSKLKSKSEDATTRLERERIQYHVILGELSLSQIVNALRVLRGLEPLLTLLSTPET